MEIEYVDAPTPVKKLSQLKLADVFMHENEVCVYLGKYANGASNKYNYLIVGEYPELVVNDDVEVMPVKAKLSVEI